LKNKRTQKVLIIAKNFPPLESAQALQAIKIAESLDNANSSIHVITELDIHKTAQYNIEKEKYNFPITYIPKDTRMLKKGLILTKFNRILKEMNQINPFSKWTNETYLAAQEIINTFKPDIILSQSTPFDSHIVAYKLSKTNSTKWIASFSDPFPIHIAPFPYNKSNYIPIFALLQFFILKKVLQGSSAIHVPSKYVAQLMERATGVDLQKKTFIIPHIGNTAPTTKGTSNGYLIHLGHLNKERSSVDLLTAIKEFTRENKGHFKGLLCVGKTCDQFIKHVHKMELTDIVKFKDPVTPEMATKLAQKAHALLVIEAQMKYSPFLPSKFADYALTQKPILAITPEKSAITEYLNRYNGGIAVPHDHQKIKDALAILFLNGNTHFKTDSKRQLMSIFSSNYVGQQYVDMFHQIQS